MVAMAEKPFIHLIQMPYAPCEKGVPTIVDPATVYHKSSAELTPRTNVTYSGGYRP